MAIKFQFNKTSMQQLSKELKIREKALPTLQAKEAALRVEVKKARATVRGFEQELETYKKQADAFATLWGEYPENLIQVSEVKLNWRKLAGVHIPTLDALSFSLGEIYLHAAPAWLGQGAVVMQKQLEISTKIKVSQEALQRLEYARKKTTQKVNLYEKVQIPEYKDILLKIKRYMEDEENLAKSSQKILKQRLAALEEEEAA